MVFDYTNFRNRKSILFDIGKLAFMISIDFKIFESFQCLSFLFKKSLKKICSISSREQIIIWMKIVKPMHLNFCLRTISKYLKRLNFYNVYIFQKFGFSNFENDFWDIIIVRNLKSILFDIEMLAFMMSIDFKNFDFFQFLSFFTKEIFQKYDFRKSSAIFWSRNNYLNKEFGRYLLPSKWVWTDLFVRGYL